MEEVPIQKWDVIVLRWRELYDRAPANQRSTSEVALPHRAGRCRNEENRCSSSHIQVCTCRKEFPIRGWAPILPGWCDCIIEPQSTSYTSISLGFTHPSRRCQPGWPSVSTRGNSVLSPVLFGFVSVWSDSQTADGALSSPD